MPDVEKGITITFRGNTASFDASIDNIEKALKVVQADTKALNKELKLDPTNVDKLTDKLKNLSAILELQRKEIGEYKKKILEAIEPSKELANSEDYKKLNAEFEKAAQKVSNLKDQLNEAKKNGDDVKNTEGWQKLNAEYKEANLELDKVNDEMYDLVSKDYTVLDWKKYVDGTRQLRQVTGDYNKTLMAIQSTQEKIDNNHLYVAAEHFNEVGKKAKSASDAIKQVANATKWFSAIAAGALTGAVKAAADFEKAWLAVKKVVEPTANTSYEDLKNQIKELARDIPIDIQTITEAMANAGQLGVNTDDLKEFVETILRLDSATNINAEEAAMTIAQLFHVIGENTDNIDNFVNALVRLGNNSATTERDILEMASTIGASAHQVGFTTEQILGLADALASAGLNPSSAGTAISNFLTKIDKMFAEASTSVFNYSKKTGQWYGELSVQTKKYLDLIGIEYDATSESQKKAYEQFQRMWQTDAAGTFTALIACMKEATDEGKNLNVIFEDLGVSGIKQDSTLKALVNSYPMLTDAMNMATDAFYNGEDAIKESDTAWGSFYNQLQLLKNNLTILGQELGEVILPVLNDIISKVTEWIQGFQGMDSTTKTVISVVLGLVAALTPILSIVAQVLGLVGNLNLAFGKTIIDLPKLGGLITKVGAMFNPWVLVIGAIIALIVAFWDEFDLVMYAIFGEWWHTIKTNLQELYDFIVFLLEGLWSVFKGILEGIWSGIKWVWDKLQAIGLAKKEAALGLEGGANDHSTTRRESLTEMMVAYSGGLGVPVMMAGGTSLSLQTTIQVNNNGTPIDEQEIRRWGNVITDMVSDNLGKRW